MLPEFLKIIPIPAYCSGLQFCDQIAETLLLFCPYLLGMASVIPICFFLCSVILDIPLRSDVNLILSSFYTSHIWCAHK